MGGQPGSPPGKGAVTDDIVATQGLKIQVGYRVCLPGKEEVLSGEMSFTPWQIVAGDEVIPFFS